MHIFGDSACFDRSVGLQFAQDVLAVAVDGMDVWADKRKVQRE